MKKKILAIIPARGGSKGIPGKNIKLLHGKPLIHYTIEAARQSKLITRVMLSSDDRQIIDYCRKQGIEAPFVRPAILAKDSTPMLKVVIHAIAFLKKSEGYVPDYIVLLQPTSPLRRTRHIDEAIRLIEKRKVDSVVSVTEVPHNFNPCSVMRFKKGLLEAVFAFKETNNLRQKKPKFYARNGPAVLVFKSECLVNKKSLYGDKIAPYFMSREESIDIDNLSDFKLASYLLRKKI